jgi:hypothetical protein
MTLVSYVAGLLCSDGKKTKQVYADKTSELLKL